MLKRLFCMILFVLFAASVCICASASDAETAATSSAPDDLRFVFTYPNEGSECIEAVFAVPWNLSSLANDETHACCIQFDWSIDSRDAFHYDKSWDAAGGDYPIQQLSGSFVEKCEVFWFAYPEAANRCAGALNEASEDGATVRTFDFSGHKLYVRARFMLYTYASGDCMFSDWSDVYDVGADRDAETPKITDTGKDRPKCTNALLEGNTLRFFIEYPDSIRKTALELLSGHGAQLRFESQIRADGGEWQYWAVEHDDLPYLTDRSTDISELASAKTVEYRCRLIGHDPSNGNAIITGWSDYVTVRDGQAEIVENDDPFGVKAEAKRQADAEKEATKCKLCGFCPFHPFGVCMFIWLGALLLVALVVVYNIIAVKKKKQRAAEIRAREEASRRSAPDKTGSFILTDRVTLTQKDEPQTEGTAAEETQEDETDET